MVHIPDIQSELILPAQTIAPVRLSPPGDAGLHFVTSSLFAGQPRSVTHCKEGRSLYNSPNLDKGLRSADSDGRPAQLRQARDSL